MLFWFFEQNYFISTCNFDFKREKHIRCGWYRVYRSMKTLACFHRAFYSAEIIDSNFWWKYARSHSPAFQIRPQIVVKYSRLFSPHVTIIHTYSIFRICVCVFRIRMNLSLLLLDGGQVRPLNRLWMLTRSSPSVFSSSVFEQSERKASTPIAQWWPFADDAFIAVGESPFEAKSRGCAIVSTRIIIKITQMAEHLGHAIVIQIHNCSSLSWRHDHRMDSFPLETTNTKQKVKT